MQELIDKENSLSWKKVCIHDLGVCDKERALINFWASPDIKEFLTDRYPLGELFNTYMGSNSSICYCYISQEDSVDFGLVLPNQKQKELAGAALIYYPFSEGEPLSIEAMVVNPKMVGKGIATNMVSSIKLHPEFFGNALHTGKVEAAVHKHNIASQKVFLKNKFKVMQKASPFGMFDKCLVYFQYERQREK